MRSAQKSIIGRIEEATKSGYPNIVVCAPVGVGKSHIAVTFARHFGGSSIITHQKVLQDQYADNFRFLASAKGRQNYPCIMICNDVDPHGKNRTGPETTCANGKCSYRYGGKTRWCEYKPKIEDFETMPAGAVVGPSGACHYYNAKYIAMLSKHSLYNYAAYYHFKRFGNTRMDSECVVADEAHEIEETLVNHASITIPRDDFRMCGLDMPKGNIDDILDGLGEIVKTCYGEIRSAGIDADTQRWKRLEEKCSTISFEGRKDPENIVFEIKNGEIALKPVSVKGMARRMFDGKRNLFLSGTIHGEMFCGMMGIDSRDCRYIEVKDHPFELKNRTMHFLNSARLTEKSRETDFDAAYTSVVRILAKHHDEKGIILTTSKKQCMQLSGKIKNREVIMAFGPKRDEAVKRHVESPRPSVLLAPGMWSGADLSGERSRFQIILKVPYLSMADIRISHKTHLWYKYQALVKFLQGCGRSVRHETDYSVTYVIDSGIADLVRSMRKYIPAAYLDAIDMAMQ